MKRIILFSLLSALLMSTGCAGTQTMEFPVSDALQFSPNVKRLPLVAGVHVSREESNKMFKGFEGGTTGCGNIIGPIGATIEPNTVLAMKNVFDRAVIVKNPELPEENVDLIINVSISDTDYSYKFESFTAYRMAKVEITTEATDLEGNLLFRTKESAETYCEKYQCKVGGQKEGQSSADVLAKTLFVPFYVYTTNRYIAVFEMAVSSSLRDALQKTADAYLAKGMDLL